jgi:hypothetical protein
VVLDERWGQAVFSWCDPVFQLADVGFDGRFSLDGATVSAFLWEAEPRRFVERYPDSDVIESYGEEQWPDVTCIDYWIYVDADRGCCRVSAQGWNLSEFSVDATGNGDVDGMRLAGLLARILAVPWPPR